MYLLNSAETQTTSQGKKILDISVDVHWLYKVINYIILQL